MEKSVIGFVQPKRRLTRQRSGFNVSGIKTGSECKILPTQRLSITGTVFKLTKVVKNIFFTKLFSDDIGIFGIGGYIKTNKNLPLTLEINLSKDNNLIKQTKKNINLIANHWTRVGTDIEINVKNEMDKYDVEANIILNANENPYVLEIFGLCAGVIKYYAEKPKDKTIYYEKTDLYKPDIYYLDQLDFQYDNSKTTTLENGFLVCKSCNRCARFLPIDIGNEKNALGFSNHCKKKAPCTHNAFSRYKIENLENIGLIPTIYHSSVIDYEKDKYIKTYFGFQLECRSCKKFVVNAPLNPLRNKAQHHEDGARRRAFERLIIELTGTDIVKNFRSTHGEEYQEYIWNKFSRQCFGCGKELKEITDMDIDHTLPLVYLWPLDESATALCRTCNSIKHELFPSEFKYYHNGKLSQLSKLSGIPLRVLESKERIVNKKVADLLVKNVVWLFESFLARKDYQKVKKGKKVADLIYKALNKILTTIDIDLVAVYKEQTGKLPQTVTLA